MKAEPALVAATEALDTLNKVSNYMILGSGKDVNSLLFRVKA